MTEPVRPQPIDETRIVRRFVRGRVAPRGVVWLGFRSFWGHMRHFVASAVATEDVDSRAWMAPDEPEALVDRMLEVLGQARAETSEAGSSLTERMGRDVFIDFVADTGDDISVSRAVAKLIAAPYELPDPELPGAWLVAPRGDLLMFGGDTAYPVATAQEISNRVLVPFNEVLKERDDGRRRVLIGIPGNHDWYDGLDGFGRLFRRRERDEAIDERPSMVGIPFGQLGHAAGWARELLMGGTMPKPDGLVMYGHEAVQSASYFVLPVSPTVHILGVDRQLRSLDVRQVRFHRRWLDAHPEVAPWVVLPDPLFAFGEPSKTGVSMVRDLGLSFERQDCFLLSGDIHHYERIEEPGLLHVTAGGGGAFLHPAPMVRGRRNVTARWPSARQCKALLWAVPFKIALGRSGLIPHVALAIIIAPAMLLGRRLFEVVGLSIGGPILTTLVVTAVLALIGGVRRRPRAVVLLAFAFALGITSLPPLAALLLERLLAVFGAEVPSAVLGGFTLLAGVLIGAGLVGGYLATLTRLGLEEMQAFTSLDHPGFKHFVRLRVRADGQGVDAWCIGLTDPLREGERPVLVDAFQFRPKRGSES